MNNLTKAQQRQQQKEYEEYLKELERRNIEREELQKLLIKHGYSSNPKPKLLGKSFCLLYKKSVKQQATNLSYYLNFIFFLIDFSFV